MSLFFDRNKNRMAEDINTQRAVAEVEPLTGKRLKNAKAIEIELIEADPQHREHFDAESLGRLAKSMKTDGQLQPVRVRYDSSRGRYIIIAGERRFRAAKLAELATLDCIVVEGEVSESDILRQQILENALREDLKPSEQAKAFLAAMKAEGLNGKELAERLNLHPSTISRALAVLELPSEVQAKVDEGTLAMTKAIKGNSGTNTATGTGASKRRTKVKTIRTSVGITLTIKARKNLLEDQIVSALEEVLAGLRSNSKAA